MFLISLAFAACGRRNSAEGFWLCKKQVFSRFTDPAVGPLALYTARHDAGITQNFHVIGQCRLADVQVFQQDAGAFFSAAEHLQDLQAAHIAERFEYLSNRKKSIYFLSLPPHSGAFCTGA